MTTENEQLRFDGLVALITGAGRGLGRAYARLLASRGCRVVVNDLSVDPAGKVSEGDAAGQVAEEIITNGGAAIADRNDVVTGGEAMVRNALESFGRLDILINNAGTLRAGDFASLSEKEWRRVHDVHLLGAVNVTRAAWRPLANSEAAVVLNTGSTAMFGLAELSNYSAAKGGIFSLSRSLAIEGREDGIRVNCVLPAAATRLTGGLPAEHRRERERLMRAEDVAALVAWLVHPSTRCTGIAVTVGGNRARSVHFAVGDSVGVEAATPEAWAEAGPALFDVTEVRPMTDMYEHVALHADELGLPGFTQPKSASR